jgi:hypothetical protein
MLSASSLRTAPRFYLRPSLLQLPRFVLDTRSGQRHSLRTIRRVVPDRQGCRASNPAIRSERYANRAARAGLQTRAAERTAVGLPEAVGIRAAHRDAADD